MSAPARAWPEAPAAPPPGARLAAGIADADLATARGFVAGPPHAAFDALRRQGGIAWHAEPPVAGTMGDNPLLQFVDAPGFWAVTSHALVGEVDRDQERFSSEAGGTFLPSLAEDSLAMFRQMMLNMDHPGHSRLRRILQPIFTPRSIERLRASVAANAAEIVDDAGTGEREIDLVTAVAAEMPLRVLADLLGMPRDDRGLIFAWSNALLGAENPSAAQHAADSMDALAGMMAYGQAMADDRRARPRDDIVSRIVNAEVDGERLNDAEFQMFWLLLIVAGNETTRNAVAGAVVALHEHDLWRWLAEHPEHLDTAVEELLRYLSPVQQFRRTATRDTLLGDQRVRAGDKVVIWFGAANRDPEVFADPHGLDLRRDPNPHVAFGVGPHFCLGAHLARLETAVLLRALLDRAPGMEIGAPTRVASNFINGIAHLPVRLDGRAGPARP
ncbi:MAG TPA: cytochrome P450 [Acidimicrobiales bacterium]|nr:cytochrome P450 [Acidimicrobiales bacterium]